MNKKIHVARYLTSDLLSAAVAWSAFYVYRKVFIESTKFGYQIPIELSSRFYLGLIFIPLFWILLYYVTGYYKDIYRKSRLQELGQTLYTTFTGVLIIFFTLILNDIVYSYKNYYISFLVLFGLHFCITYIPRLIITSATIKKLRIRKIGFNTLIIGSNGKALELFLEFKHQIKSSGNKFIGFVNVNEGITEELALALSHLGGSNDLVRIIKDYQVEEVIIAIESEEHEQIWKIINKLAETNVIIKVIPTMYDILTGSVNMSTPFGAPLIEIKHDLMPAWQENVKRLIDIFVSLFALILLTPFYIGIAIGVLLSSKGPILYSHERIGRYGKPFIIYKFRSMFVDAEKNGPALSSAEDKRITKFGKFMRKVRLDELPQFYNVLIGDMSLVGPRPERQYFIDQIVNIAPHYSHLQKVRPGITSWGMVKFGYAENVKQMVERLKYDIIYIENMSLYADLKILIYTIKTILQGSGK